ncbi:MAG: YbjN domain-containing protein [Oscillospiraceae bacterium]|nr:YbjN domain-containing protein [Oscillospiraceae bacterium]
MKIQKSLLAFPLILVLMFSLGVSAFAGDASFEATKDYMDALRRLEGASCEALETLSIGGKEFEAVNISYAGKLSDHEFSFLTFVCEDGTEALLQINLLEYDPENLAELLAAVNDFHANTTGVKLFLDVSDNSLIAETHLLLTQDSVFDLAPRATANLITLVDKMVEDFGSFAL